MTLTHVAALIDDLYAREYDLQPYGINSFAPLLRVVEDFSATEEELKEYRNFRIANAKNSVVKNPEFIAQQLQLRQEAQERFEATGNVWERELRSLEKRWRRRQFEAHPREIYKILRPYKEERTRLWAIELGKFAGRLADEFGARSKSRMALYKAVMEAEQEKTGLILDRQLSSGRAPIYSMPVGQNWKVCFRLDHVLLAKPNDGWLKDEHTGEIILTSVQFDFWMQIWQRVKDGAKFKKVAPLSFAWLFPIGSTFFGPASYSHFASLRELDAVIRIHMQMFLLIRQDLTSALLSESATK